MANAPDILARARVDRDNYIEIYNRVEQRQELLNEICQRLPEDLIVKPAKDHTSHNFGVTYASELIHIHNIMLLNFDHDNTLHVSLSDLASDRTATLHFNIIDSKTGRTNDCPMRVTCDIINNPDPQTFDKIIELITTTTYAIAKIAEHRTAQREQ